MLVLAHRQNLPIFLTTKFENSIPLFILVVPTLNNIVDGVWSDACLALFIIKSCLQLYIALKIH